MSGTSQSDPYRLNLAAVRKAYGGAAASYDIEAVLQTEVRQQLLKRLELTLLEPQVVLDLGCAVGAGSTLLQSRYPGAHVVALDFSGEMLKQAQTGAGDTISCLLSDFCCLPFPDHSVDLIFANLALHCTNDLDGVFVELSRVLKPEGLFTFSTFGPDSLKELRSAWKEADEGVHVHRFFDMHDLGDGLIRAGFSEPVMDVDQLIMSYANGRAAMADLKKIGESNCAMGRSRGLMGKAKLNRVLETCQRYETDGRFNSTFELIFGQAWGRSEINQTKYQGGEVHIPISSLRRR